MLGLVNVFRMNDSLIYRNSQFWGKAGKQILVLPLEDHMGDLRKVQWGRMGMEWGAGLLREDFRVFELDFER